MNNTDIEMEELATLKDVIIAASLVADVRAEAACAVQRAVHLDRQNMVRVGCVCAVGCVSGRKEIIPIW